MKKTPSLLVALAAAAALAAPAFAADAPAKFSGGVLVDGQGMTLYTFDKDAADSGKSACTGPCATLWPPALADGAAQASAPFGVVTRDDGLKQWSYKGKPLYHYQADKKPGDRAGDNFKDIWHVVKE